MKALLWILLIVGLAIMASGLLIQLLTSKSGKKKAPSNKAQNGDNGIFLVMSGGDASHKSTLSSDSPSAATGGAHHGDACGADAGGADAGGSGCD